MRTNQSLKAIKVTFAIVASFLSSIATASPKTGKFGLGIALFDPTGPTVKYKMTDKQAIDGAIGWSYRGIHLHVQYLIDEINLANRRDFDFNFYYGAGVRIVTNSSKERLGIRVPVGLSLFLAAAPIEFYSELAIVLNLVRETSVDLDLTLGARYFF